MKNEITIETYEGNTHLNTLYDVLSALQISGNIGIRMILMMILILWWKKLIIIFIIITMDMMLLMKNGILNLLLRKINNYVGKI